ncbi:MAG: hypothetical protein JNL43_12035 [Flavobacteriales bacterium]|nr:hypothetical protein [Flavobacteriales bacterium]
MCSFLGSRTIFLALGIALTCHVTAQDTTRTRIPFTDTLDGAIDMSRFLIEYNGFLPVTMVITEPALGGFGLALAPIFLSQKPAQADGRRYPPDMTAAFAMYTANKSWGTGGGRVGTIIPWGIRYRVFAAYADVNMDFYRTVPGIGEQRVGMNMEALPVLLQAIKQVGRTPFYGGLRYIWSNVKSSSREERFSEFFGKSELDRTTSLLGAVVEFDTRDNVFTTNTGWRAHVDANVSSTGLGSDFDYQSGETFIHGWWPFSTDWVSGIRVQANHVWGDPAYYQQPFVQLRGIPMMRYQGRVTTVVETEQRIHLWRRWSTVAFVGAGRATASWETWGIADTPVNYGFGPRYLIARAFGIQAGFDVAWGPDSFGWYITIGNAWIR